MAQTIISLLYYEGKGSYVKMEQKVSDVKKDGEEVEEGGLRVEMTGGGRS